MVAVAVLLVIWGTLKNSYCLYYTFFNKHDRVPPLNHYEYICAIVLVWLDQERYCPRKTKSRNIAITTSSRSGSNSVMSRLRPSGRVSKATKNITFTNRSLDPYMDALRWRLDTHASYLPEKSNNKVSNCQFCYWMSEKSKRSCYEVFILSNSFVSWMLQAFPQKSWPTNC